MGTNLGAPPEAWVLVKDGAFVSYTSPTKEDAEDLLRTEAFVDGARPVRYVLAADTRASLDLAAMAVDLDREREFSARLSRELEEAQVRAEAAETRLRDVGRAGVGAAASVSQSKDGDEGNVAD